MNLAGVLLLEAQPRGLLPHVEGLPDGLVHLPLAEAGPGGLGHLVRQVLHPPPGPLQHVPLQ